MGMKIRKGRIAAIFAVMLLLGLVLMGAGYALQEYYRANIADKNSDGVKDWKDCDVNGDNKVDIYDIVSIAGHVGWPTTVETYRYDINGDGFIDKWDAELAAQFYGQHLSILNIYTNQGKAFTTGLILTILSAMGVAVGKIRGF